MSLPEILLLVVAGFLSGAMNAVAGGGTFFAFGALTLIGIPPIAANATCALAMVPGYMASAANYRSDLWALRQRALSLGLASAAGAIVGALILVALDNATFARFVPWLLLLATAVFAAGPWLARRLPETVEDSRGRRLAASLVQGVMSIYGGFFGAGMGIMMLASLGLTEGQDFHRINALKHVLATIIQSTAILVFIGAGVIAWKPALVLVLAVIAGGWLGIDIARRVPTPIVRGFVIAVGLSLAAIFFLRA